MKLRISIASLLLLISAVLTAQSKKNVNCFTISGTVIDSRTEAQLPDAFVEIKTQDNEIVHIATTDSNGVFTAHISDERITDNAMIDVEVLLVSDSYGSNIIRNIPISNFIRLNEIKLNRYELEKAPVFGCVQHGIVPKKIEWIFESYISRSYYEEKPLSFSNWNIQKRYTLWPIKYK